MKLSDLKHALVEQFFPGGPSGVTQGELEEIYSSLGKLIKADLSGLSSASVQMNEATEGTSSDVSKAFKKFTEGNRSALAVLEESGSQSRAVFAAVRSGKHVAYIDLSSEARTEKRGDLLLIKQALKQAKSVNDDACFSLTNQD